MAQLPQAGKSPFRFLAGRHRLCASTSRQSVGWHRTISGRFQKLSAEDWSRTGRRSDGAAFTVSSFARYFLHDLVHHLHDVRPQDGPPPGPST